MTIVAMSHNLDLNSDTSHFNYPSAAGVRTNVEQTHISGIPTSNPSTVSMTTTSSTMNDHISGKEGKLDGEHGGAGTRTDDRKGLLVHNDGHTATPVAKEEEH